MAEYNKAFNNYIDIRTKFYLHNTTYEEYEFARLNYLKEKNKIFTNL